MNALKGSLNDHIYTVVIKTKFLFCKIFTIGLRNADSLDMQVAFQDIFTNNTPLQMFCPLIVFYLHRFCVHDKTFSTIKATHLSNLAMLVLH